MAAFFGDQVQQPTLSISELLGLCGGVRGAGVKDQKRGFSNPGSSCHVLPDIWRRKLDGSLRLELDTSLCGSRTPSGSDLLLELSSSTSSALLPSFGGGFPY